ncbi:MAG TPA: hypothetical protein VMX17_10495 [Candidatus Glassbacteria bacterium]|nr:hypothetical protein [Candidatus Glassbacteria bacterium]
MFFEDSEKVKVVIELKKRREDGSVLKVLDSEFIFEEAKLTNILCDSCKNEGIVRFLFLDGIGEKPYRCKFYNHATHEINILIENGFKYPEALKKLADRLGVIIIEGKQEKKSYKELLPTSISTFTPCPTSQYPINNISAPPTTIIKDLCDTKITKHKKINYNQSTYYISSEHQSFIDDIEKMLVEKNNKQMSKSAVMRFILDDCKKKCLRDGMIK